MKNTTLAVLFIVVVILVLVSPATSEARSAYNEDYYNRAWCHGFGGTPEVRLNDGRRVDCLTDQLAIETDWATHKTYESLLQALHYAKETDRKPAILLLIKDRKGIEWVRMLKSNIAHYSLDVVVFYIIAKERYTH